MAEVPEKVISSRAVWTKRDEEKLEDWEKQRLVLKCRIVGRGLQEAFDEMMRRDSPTCATLLVQIICSFAASRRRRKLTAAGVKGAFLRRPKIERELYFEPPRNIGKARVPGVVEGELTQDNSTAPAKEFYQSLDGSRSLSKLQDSSCGSPR